jgi:hypothetical protein
MIIVLWLIGFMFTLDFTVEAEDKESCSFMALLYCLVFWPSMLGSKLRYFLDRKEEIPESLTTPPMKER